MAGLPKKVDEAYFEDGQVHYYLTGSGEEPGKIARLPAWLLKMIAVEKSASYMKGREDKMNEIQTALNSK